MCMCVCLKSLRLVSPDQALKELGMSEHQLRFTCRVQLQDPHSDADTLTRIYTHLKRSGQSVLFSLIHFIKLFHHMTTWQIVQFFVILRLHKILRNH